MIYLGCLLGNHFHKSLECRRLRAGGEKVLLEHNAELFPDALELLEVLVVLALVLDLGVDACGAVLVVYFQGSEQIGPLRCCCNA